jgi:bifunctional non-homologous end joining protein LigD
MGLNEYKRKRDFSKTSEPKGRTAGRSGDLKFVIQKHSARRLHYDFRLEAGGVLLSWAIPKGPSLDPSVKRLAVQTEDHPLDYRKFEGVIPEGEYGAGPVIIWDEGTFAPSEHGQPCFGNRAKAEKLIREGIKKGKLNFDLRGRRLHGSWTLFRLANRQKDWILIKRKDDEVEQGYDASSQVTSVVSGWTIDQVKEGASEVR